jgi:hypothetical protein
VAQKTGSGADLEGVSAKARRDMLIDAFGSRKKKAMERSKAANIVDVDAIAAVEQVAATLRSTAAKSGRSSTAAAAAAAAADGSSDRKVADAMAAGRRAMLPRFDVAATTPEEAYPFDGLVSNEERAAMSGVVRDVIRALQGASSATPSASLDEVIAQHGKSSEFIRDRLRKLAVMASGGGPDVGSRRGGGGKGKKGGKRGGGDDEDGGDGDEDGSSAADARAAALRRRVQALLYTGYLLALYRAPNELRLKLLLPRKGAAGDEGGGGGDGGGEDSGAAAAAAAGEVAIPQLRWIPQTVQARILASFTERREDPRVHESSAGSWGAGASASASTSLGGGTYNHRTDELSDKLAAHIACLSLYVDGFVTDLRLLAMDMRLPPARLLHYFRELGCQFTPVRGLVGAIGAAEVAAAAEEGEGGDEGSAAAGGGGRGGVISYTVTLKVPLTFPKPKMARGKK